MDANALLKLLFFEKVFLGLNKGHIRKGENAFKKNYVSWKSFFPDCFQKLFSSHLLHFRFVWVKV